MNKVLHVFLLCTLIVHIRSDDIDYVRESVGLRPILDENFRPPLAGVMPLPFLPQNRPPAGPRQRICSYQYRCSDEEKIQWATDGFNCFVFRNECFLASANCDRRNQFVKILANVDKKDCQRLCRDMCPPEFRPVCAMYNGKSKTFMNTCALANHVCQSGETYNIFRIGECPFERRDVQ